MSYPYWSEFFFLVKKLSQSKRKVYTFCGYMSDSTRQPAAGQFYLLRWNVRKDLSKVSWDPQKTERRIMFPLQKLWFSSMIFTSYKYEFVCNRSSKNYFDFETWDSRVKRKIFKELDRSVGNITMRNDLINCLSSVSNRGLV